MTGGGGGGMGARRHERERDEGDVISTLRRTTSSFRDVDVESFRSGLRGCIRVAAGLGDDGGGGDGGGAPLERCLLVGIEWDGCRRDHDRRGADDCGGGSSASSSCLEEIVGVVVSACSSPPSSSASDAVRDDERPVVVAAVAAVVFRVLCRVLVSTGSGFGGGSSTRTLTGTGSRNRGSSSSSSPSGRLLLGALKDMVALGGGGSSSFDPSRCACDFLRHQVGRLAPRARQSPRTARTIDWNEAKRCLASVRLVSRCLWGDLIHRAASWRSRSRSRSRSTRSRSRSKSRSSPSSSSHALILGCVAEVLSDMYCLEVLLRRGEGDGEGDEAGTNSTDWGFRRTRRKDETRPTSDAADPPRKRRHGPARRMDLKCMSDRHDAGNDAGGGADGDHDDDDDDGGVDVGVDVDGGSERERKHPVVILRLKDGADRDVDSVRLRDDLERRRLRDRLRSLGRVADRSSSSSSSSSFFGKDDARNGGSGRLAALRDGVLDDLVSMQHQLNLSCVRESSSASATCRRGGRPPPPGLAALVSVAVARPRCPASSMAALLCASSACGGGGSDGGGGNGGGNEAGGGTMLLMRGLWGAYLSSPSSPSSSSSSRPDPPEDGDDEDNGGDAPLRRYADLLSSCSAFDDPSRCWDAFRPLADVALLLALPPPPPPTDEYHRDESSPSPSSSESSSTDCETPRHHSPPPRRRGENVLRAVAHVLGSRAGVLRGEGEGEGDDDADRKRRRRHGRRFSDLTTRLSVSFGGSSGWVVDVKCPEERAEILSTLRALGVLSLVEEDDGDDHGGDVNGNGGGEGDGGSPPESDGRSSSEQEGGGGEGGRRRWRGQRAGPDPWPFEPSSTLANACAATAPHLTGDLLSTRRRVEKGESNRHRDDAEKRLGGRRGTGTSRNGGPSVSVNLLLNDDALRTVFSFFGCKRLARVGEVCRTWNDIAHDGELWRDRYARRWPRSVLGDVGASILAPAAALADPATAPRPPSHSRAPECWRRCFVSRWRSERSVRAKFSSSGWKYRTCNWVGCPVILRTPKQLERHEGVHLRRCQRQRERDEERRTKVESTIGKRPRSGGEKVKRQKLRKLL